MSLLSVLSATLPTDEKWFSGMVVIVIVVLLVLNLLVLLAVHARGERERKREERAARFRPRFEGTLAELRSEHPDMARLRREFAELNELERPIAAEMLLAEAQAATPEQRARMLEAWRKGGVIDRFLQGTARRMSWRRALAIKALGVIRADEAVPVLIERLSDRSRYVREAAVTALGQIGDARALAPLAELFGNPGPVAPGLVHEALVSIGRSCAWVFELGLQAEDEHVRIGSVYGIAAVLEPEVCQRQLVRMLTDEEAAVRTAAAEMLGRMGGTRLPEELAALATSDEQRSVRRAAVTALAGYDDPEAVRLAIDALDDPDRDVARRGGETLVRLRAQPTIGREADAAAATNDSWPVETAKLVAALEAR